MTRIPCACLAAAMLTATPGTPLAIAQDSEYIFGPEPRYTLCNAEPVPVN